MALPTSMVVTRDPLKKTGIVLGVYPSSDPLCDVELWRSTQIASTSSSLWTVTRYPPSTTPAYTLPVPLPASTRYNYFKARSRKIGHSPSAFTATVRAKPLIFAQYPAHPPPLINNGGDAEIPATIIVPSSNAMNVGAPSQVSPTTYIEKNLTVHAADFVTFDSAANYAHTNTDVRLGTSTAITVIANVNLPAGVLVTSGTVRVYRETTANAFVINFTRRTSDNTPTVLLALSSTANTTGWYTVGGAINSTWTTHGHTVQASLVGSAPSAVRLGWANLKYRVPRYDRTI